MKFKNDLRPQAAAKWLEKAKHDLDTAFLNHRHGGYTDVTCYFGHQTVEKSLKAFLVCHSIRFKKTHHLSSLLEMCVRKDSGFLQFQEECRTLNDYYIETRYPLDLPVVYTKQEAQEAIEISEKMVEFVKEKLKTE